MPSILIVEDNLVAAMELEELLTDRGYTNKMGRTYAFYGSASGRATWASRIKHILVLLRHIRFARK